MKKLVENIGVVFLVSVLVIGLGWTLYDSVIRNEPVDTVHEANIRACERGQRRSLLDQQFALEAAKARRRNAETAAAKGDNVTAQNELATAQVYENLAEGYKNLTPKNCEVAYPTP